MTDTAAVALLTVVLVGPAVMLMPFLFARRQVERHADAYAANLRRALAARPVDERPKAGAR